MKLPLTFAGRAVTGLGRRLVSGEDEAVSAATRSRNAHELFAVLGQLKGGAMKRSAGSAERLRRDDLPRDLAEPYHEALSRLQSAAPGMPTRDVRRMLAEQLGSGWPRRFRDFDDEPSAAASGQVHRAVWADGRAVAVS